jgi:hydrogenase-4 component E
MGPTVTTPVLAQGVFANAAWFQQAINLASGLLLLTAIGALWRRQVSALIPILVVQGVAMTSIAVLLAGRHEGGAEAMAVAVVIGILKVIIIPLSLLRVHRLVPDARETRPLANVASSLLAAAGLSLLAYAAARPFVDAAASPTAGAAPIGLALVLLGFFLAATRRRAVSQIVALLLIDNGIAATAFLATDGVPLIVELGVSADLVLLVLVLQVLSARLVETFGPTDLDDLRELHD